MDIRVELELRWALDMYGREGADVVEVKEQRLLITVREGGRYSSGLKVLCLREAGYREQEADETAQSLRLRARSLTRVQPSTRPASFRRARCGTPAQSRLRTGDVRARSVRRF